ncbi:alpha/beta fold hydrolase [Dyella subtropica]|uniref:alpha/beta fold hydrolase n=1 Tax=Dyella subtropica TaxID=2992127 RepID=UPI0022530D26|nr:hypothetical protein [Dyella subtropica]
MKINGLEHAGVITDTWLRAYGSRFARPTDCLGAIGWAKGFARGEHRFEVPDADAKREIKLKPALAIWGMADRTLGASHFLPLFEELFPSARTHRLAGVGHYSFEHAPEAVSTIIGEFLVDTAPTPSR